MTDIGKINLASLDLAASRELNTETALEVVKVAVTTGEAVDFDAGSAKTIGATAWDKAGLDTTAAQPKGAGAESAGGCDGKCPCGGCTDPKKQAEAAQQNEKPGANDQAGRARSNQDISRSTLPGVEESAGANAARNLSPQGDTANRPNVASLKSTDVFVSSPAAPADKASTDAPQQNASTATQSSAAKESAAPTRLSTPVQAAVDRTLAGLPGKGEQVADAVKEFAATAQKLATSTSSSESQGASASIKSAMTSLAQAAPDLSRQQMELLEEMLRQMQQSAATGQNAAPGLKADAAVSALGMVLQTAAQGGTAAAAFSAVISQAAAANLSPESMGALQNLVTLLQSGKPITSAELSPLLNQVLSGKGGEQMATSLATLFAQVGGSLPMSSQAALLSTLAGQNPQAAQNATPEGKAFSQAVNTALQSVMAGLPASVAAVVQPQVSALLGMAANIPGFRSLSPQLAAALLTGLAMGVAGANGKALGGTESAALLLSLAKTGITDSPKAMARLIQALEAARKEGQTFTPQQIEALAQRLVKSEKLAEKEKQKNAEKQPLHFGDWLHLLRQRRAAKGYSSASADEMERRLRELEDEEDGSKREDEEESEEEESPDAGEETLRATA
ncbi:MAG: hypothetical protein AAF654_04355 [Myxococcota bacterium]